MNCNTLVTLVNGNHGNTIVPPCQECDDRERTISELNVREKQLKQEISSLYEQLELCEQRDRTGTEGSFRSRMGN